MPSLARKSMNFMRDVYNIAANPGVPPLPTLPSQSQGFQPNQGLSGQFNQTYPYQQHPPPPLPSYPLYAPPSPYVSPSSGPPQPQPQPYGSWSIPPTPISPPSQYVPPSSGPPQPQQSQPHGSWSIPPTPISPPLSQPSFNFPPNHDTTPSFAPGHGLPISPPTSFSSPSTPQTYQQQVPQIELQYFPTQPPPLPQRPTQHGPSLSWQGPSEPGWHNQSQLGAPLVTPSDHELVPAQQFPFNPALDTQNVRLGAYSGPVESQNSQPPVPPPLPPRMQTPKADVVDDHAGNVSSMVLPPGPNYGNYNSTPAVFEPSTSVPSGYHEMPAESLTNGSIAHNHCTTEVWGFAELPAPMGVQSLASVNAPSGNTTMNVHTNNPTDGAVELPASPIKTTSQHLPDRLRHQRHISGIQAAEFSPEHTDELDSMEFLHRDLGVALPPITFNKSSNRMSNQQTPNKLPTPPPSISTPSEISCLSDSTEQSRRGKLQAATSLHEPRHSRRTSAAALPYPEDDASSGGPSRNRSRSFAALPYPEDNESVTMPLHLDYMMRQDLTVQGLR